MPPPAGNPPFTKCTFFFTDGRYGWSEDYYYQTPIFTGAPPALVSTAWTGLQNALKNLIAARTALLASTASDCGWANACAGPPILAYVRCSTVGIPRATRWLVPSLCNAAASSTLTTSTGSGGGSFGSPADQVGASGPSDNPYSGLEFVVNLGNGLTAKRTISGVPDVVVCDQLWAICGPWSLLFSNFLKVLTNGSWGVASNSIGNNAAAIPGSAVNILSVDNSGDPYGRPTLTLESPITFRVLPSGCPDFRVQIVCYKSNPGRWPNINGVHRVVVNNNPSATTSEITLTQGYKPLSPWIRGQLFAYQGSFFTPIVGGQIVRPMMKKRGSPFDRPHGRAALTR